MWKTLRVSHIPTPSAATTDKLQTRRYTNNLLGTKDRSGHLVSQCDDPVVALLALDCERNGLVSKPLNKTLWASHMTQDALYDENWFLAYEANIKNWLPTAGGGDHVAADVNFGFLKANGVYFYDASLAAPPAAAPAVPAPVPLPTVATVSTLGMVYSP